jgi:predicted Zn-dependent protease
MIWRRGGAAGATAIALVLLVAGCGLPADEGGQRGEGPGGRYQPLGLPPQEEYRVGLEAYQKVLSEYRDRLLPDDAPESVRVRGIMGRIVKAAGIEPLQREIHLRIHGYRFGWEVHVVREQKINAFCLPAGKMIVFTGILPVAQDDDQLATVMSHEIAHALAHHASERVARERNRSGAAILRSLSFQRDQELEADHIGLFLMTFAGYDPHEAVRFWERMQQISGAQGGRPEFMSDHPSDAHRVQAMKEWVPRAIAGKKAYDEGRIAPAPGR